MGLIALLRMVYVGEAFRLPAVKCCKFAKMLGEFATVYPRDGKPVPYDNTPHRSDERKFDNCYILEYN